MGVLSKHGLANTAAQTLISNYDTPDSGVDYLGFVATLEEWTWRGW